MDILILTQIVHPALLHNLIPNSKIKISIFRNARVPILNPKLLTNNDLGFDNNRKEIEIDISISNKIGL